MNRPVDWIEISEWSPQWFKDMNLAIAKWLANGRPLRVIWQTEKGKRVEIIQTEKRS
jgi:hypothetical protein